MDSAEQAENDLEDGLANSLPPPSGARYLPPSSVDYSPSIWDDTFNAFPEIGSDLDEGQVLNVEPDPASGSVMGKTLEGRPKRIGLAIRRFIPASNVMPSRHLFLRPRSLQNLGEVEEDKGTVDVKQSRRTLERPG